MKNKIRKEILAKMKISNRDYDENLCQRLFATVQWNHADVVAVTLSMDDELDTNPIIEKAFQQNKQVVIPKTFSNRVMKFFAFDNSTKIEKSNFGVREPVDANEVYPDDIDLIIVPGVAFNPSTHQRIGFGGGFFDCYLSSYSGDTISLVRPEQVVNKNWLSEETDIPVQLIIRGDDND
ncbi:5-formyltetrahydrofolate cyclo-ligase [Fructilactobacillus vespulae]|uniref:5-formyltetrahydrofolate cyclo-ligase n=1 Tax=Fructilactobacillus vespulae TaxID=1249630 RepID=UPI0039B3A6B9